MCVWSSLKIKVLVCWFVVLCLSKYSGFVCCTDHQGIVEDARR